MCLASQNTSLIFHIVIKMFSFEVKYIVIFSQLERIKPIYIPKFYHNNIEIFGVNVVFKQYKCTTAIIKNMKH